MSIFERHEGQILVLSRTVGPLSAGTPVEILEQGDDWATVRTVRPMPHIAGMEMDSGRPIVGVNKSMLTWRRQRAKNIKIGKEK